VVPAENLELIDSVIDYVFDFLRDEFLKKAGIPRRIIALVSTIANIDGFFVINLILEKYGYAYLLKWIWWLSLI
jgi:hypothetical protein